MPAMENVTAPPPWSIPQSQDRRMMAVHGGYRWVAGAPGRCACALRGYGIAGKCLAHAGQQENRRQV